MHPHISRPRRKATRTCTDTAGVVRTVHGEFMWPFTARVNEKTAPIERIAAVAICRRLTAALCVTVKSDVRCPLWVISRHLQRKKACPLYPRKRTCAMQLGMSAMGQKRTSGDSLLFAPDRTRPSWIEVLVHANAEQPNTLITDLIRTSWLRPIGDEKSNSGWHVSTV